MQQKLSVSIVNESSNPEGESDFNHCDIPGKLFNLFYVTRKGTAWYQMCSVSDLSMKTTQEFIEIYWICIHCAPLSISGDDAYDKPAFQKFLKQPGINYMQDQHSVTTCWDMWKERTIPSNPNHAARQRSSYNRLPPHNRAGLFLVPPFLSIAYA